MRSGEVLWKKKYPSMNLLLKRSRKLKKPPYKGIHSVYSGFNQAFREYFKKDPVEATTKLAQEGKIVTRPVKGGATLYLPEDAPSQSKGVLNKILEEDGSDKTQEGGKVE